MGFFIISEGALGDLVLHDFSKNACVHRYWHGQWAVPDEAARATHAPEIRRIRRSQALRLR